MATPQFQLQTVPMVVAPNSPGSMRILSKDPTGAPIDIHTGYAVGAFNAAPNASSNQGDANVSMSTLYSVAFDATGLTISWTAAQANNILAALLYCASVGVVLLTNDSSATLSQIAAINVQLQNAAGIG